MGLESFIGTYIDGLNASNPVGATDTKDEGDDHIRGIKLVLQNTFPSITGAVSATHTELNYLDIASLGTAAASKALVPDGSANLDAGAITFTDLGTVTTADVNGGTFGGFTIDGNWTAAGQTCADLGTVSDADFTQLTLGGSAAMTAIETTLAGSATKLARADGIKAYIDAAIAALTTIETFTSSAYTTYATGSSLAGKAHGLSGTPQVIHAYMICTDAGGDLGYSQNDVVGLASTGTPLQGQTFWADATNVYGEIDILKIVSASTQASTTPTAGKWSLHIVAMYYS